MPDRTNAERWRALARALALLAGAMDATTGALLIAAPAFTLRMMFIEMPPGAGPFVRFIGAFVLGVGLSYFPPFLRHGRARCDAALRAVFVTTGLIRLSIGLFTGVAVASSMLAAAWLSVTLSDLTLAALQGYIVKRGVLDDQD